MSAIDFFTSEQKKEIVNAVKEAEKNTSGEIRVHIEEKVKGDVLDRSAYLFEVLKMHKTEKRNGVLFYLAYKSHDFAILGDAGINNVVPENFWDNIKEMMLVYFKEGRFVEGLSVGIREAGNQLKQHFPYMKHAKNMA